MRTFFFIGFLCNAFTAWHDINTGHITGWTYAAVAGIPICLFSALEK